jgi:hypothetical protein
MSDHQRRTKLIIVAGVTLVLGGLVSWQWRRQSLAQACEANGYLWDGAQSICRPPLPGPILKRDGLQRG